MAKLKLTFAILLVIIGVVDFVWCGTHMSPLISQQYANVLFFIGMLGVVAAFLGVVFAAAIVDTWGKH